jgi:hypothetical protein
VSPWGLAAIIQVGNVLDQPIVSYVKTANIVSIVLKMVALVVFAVSCLFSRV